MSSTTTDQKFIDARATLAEPHFDEESTVLSARPVVPLEKVRPSKAGTILARPWVLGLGLAGSLLIGVVATALFYSKSNGINSTLFEGLEVASGVEGISEEAANSFSGPAFPQPKTQADKPNAISQPAPANSRTDKANSEPGSKPRLVAVIRERKSNSDIEEDREADRRESRRQARRERRRTERESRDGKSSDELMRIREIFEGSPRP